MHRKRHWSRPQRLSSGECGADQRVEKFLVGGAVERLHFAVGEDDRERRLSRHFEPSEHFAALVVDLRECQAVLVDELLEAVFATAPSDADDLGLTGPTL